MDNSFYLMIWKHKKKMWGGICSTFENKEQNINK